MKRITALILSLAFLVSTGSCAAGGKSSSASGDSSAMTEELSAPEKLTNHMTENERSKISVGELTVFDHEQKEQEPIVPTDGVYLELWTYDDSLADYKKYYDESPEDFDGMSFEEAVKYNDKFFKEFHGGFIDGEMVFTFGLDPVIGYDGGELSIDAPLPVYTMTDDGENFYYVDADKNKVPEEEAVERLTSYYNEQPKITFESFEEFKPYIKECIDLNIALYPMEHPEYEDVYRKESYDEVVELWEAVIDNSYKTLPVGTTEKWQAQFDTPAEAVWEIDHEKVQAIAPYVKEYNIYDEQLDTNFVVHVTLPPDFDPDRTYPAFVLTDAVWRFNNCADMRKSMEEGKAGDVILISIGYDYSINGADDTNRIKFFCDRCEDFLNFITDDLMPYMGEQYNIDFGDSTFFGHSLGGTFAHYAVFNSDRYENQPFKNYIIGSPAFWSPGFLPYTEGDEFKDEYGYFDRNDSLDKNVFICGGADEDPVYEEYYGENESTLEGIASLMKRLEEHGVTTAESKLYPDSEHYQFIPEMLVEMLEKYYPAEDK